VAAGNGKTTVALVYLHSHMTETGRPVAYLCPTTQIVEQVLREAEILGIKAVGYPDRQSLPDPEAAAGKSIIVCSYDRQERAKRDRRS